MKYDEREVSLDRADVTFDANTAQRIAQLESDNASLRARLAAVEAERDAAREQCRQALAKPFGPTEVQCARANGYIEGRAAAVKEAAKVIRAKCEACCGNGIGGANPDGSAYECEYCGRPMRAVQSLIPTPPPAAARETTHAE